MIPTHTTSNTDFMLDMATDGLMVHNRADDTVITEFGITNVYSVITDVYSAITDVYSAITNVYSVITDVTLFITGLVTQ